MIYLCNLALICTCTQNKCNQAQETNVNGLINKDEKQCTCSLVFYVQWNLCVPTLEFFRFTKNILTLTLNNDSLIICQSINSNNDLFVYTSLEQFHNISNNGCRHVIYKESENFHLHCISNYLNHPT
jgi:hypothetical protein